MAPPPVGEPWAPGRLEFPRRGCEDGQLVQLSGNDMAVLLGVWLSCVGSSDSVALYTLLQGPEWGCRCPLFQHLLCSL